MKPTNYPMKNPRFPWKYEILDWKCEYIGHYDLEIEFNQAEPDARFDHTALKEVLSSIQRLVSMSLTV